MHAHVLSHFSHTCMHTCWTLCDPGLDCSLPGSSVCGVLQARLLECVTTPSSRGSSQSSDRTHISYISCTGRLGSLPLALPGKPLLSIFIAKYLNNHFNTICSQRRKNVPTISPSRLTLGA